MITKIKIFESINEKSPEVGDWVICEEFEPMLEIGIFTSNNIGKFIKYDGNEAYPYIIKFDNIPKELETFFSNNERNMLNEEIKYWSKNIEDIQLILKTNKFNV